MEHHSLHPFLYNPLQPSSLATTSFFSVFMSLFLHFHSFYYKRVANIEKNKIYMVKFFNIKIT